MAGISNMLNIMKRQVYKKTYKIKLVLIKMYFFATYKIMAVTACCFSPSKQKYFGRKS